MKAINKKHIITILVISFLIVIPTIIGVIPNPIDIRRSWKNDLPDSYRHASDVINATMGYEDRKNTYLQDSNQSDGFHAQSTRIYLNTSVNQASFTSSLSKINNRQDTADFSMGGLLRMMYLDNVTKVLEPTFKQQLKDAMLRGSHQPIHHGHVQRVHLFHGQLFPPIE